MRDVADGGRCAAGSYTGDPGSLSCGICPAGARAPVLHAACASSYKPIAAVLCPCRLSCKVTQHHPYLCNLACRHLRLIKKLTACLGCCAGYYAPAGTGGSGPSMCLPCAPGTSSAGNVTACTSCPAGTYQAQPAQPKCNLCPQGTTLAPAAVSAPVRRGKCITSLCFRGVQITVDILFLQDPKPLSVSTVSERACQK